MIKVKKNEQNKKSTSQQYYNEPFPTRFRELFGNFKGLTQDTLANEIAKLLQNESEKKSMNKKIKITRQTIGHYMNGDSLPNDINVVKAIANFFKVSIDYLIGNSDLKCANEEIITACNITGLSEESIILLNDFLSYEDYTFDNALKKTKEATRLFVLSKFIESFDFSDFSHLFGYIANYTNIAYLQRNKLEPTIKYFRDIIKSRERCNKEDYNVIKDFYEFIKFNCGLMPTIEKVGTSMIDFDFLYRELENDNLFILDSKKIPKESAELIYTILCKIRESINDKKDLLFFRINKMLNSHIETVSNQNYLFESSILF